MSLLFSTMFAVVAVSAIVLAWQALADARQPINGLLKWVRVGDRIQTITITYPSLAQTDEVGAPAYRSLRPYRPRVSKVPAHRLHSFSRPRHAA